ncbi:hypothetical protein K8R32_03740 [bacterium]|nr:hypothetical protein [bacterium]
MQKNILIKYIPERHNIGAIIRTDDNLSRRGLLRKAIKQLLSIERISLIHVMIHRPNEENGIWHKLIKTFGKEKKRVVFEKVYTGNFHNDLLNFAIGEQIRRGIDYSISISSEAYPYATKGNIDKMLEAAKDGACAIGLKIKEYADLIKLGYLSNAFCMYKNTLTNFVNIWDINASVKNKTAGELDFGAEEVYVINNLIDTFGKNRVAVVNPSKGLLIESKDKKSQEKRSLVKKTKMKRFNKLCEFLNINTEYLQKNIDWRK